MPAELAASAIVNEPAAVLAAPDPSAIVSVATAPLTVTDCSDPPEGTLANVHGAVPAVYGRERVVEGREHLVDLAVRVRVLHDERHELRGDDDVDRRAAAVVPALPTA